MKHVLLFSLLLLACKTTPSESVGSGGMGQGSGAEPTPPAGQEGQGQGGGLFQYQPCDQTCTGGCLSVPDGDKTIGVCAAPCQVAEDCPKLGDSKVVCQEHKCGIACTSEGTCPQAGMKCVGGLCGYPLPSPQ